MNKFAKLLTSFALIPALLLPATFAKADARTELGIVIPVIATSVVALHNYIHFNQTGEFAICDDGKDESACRSGKYLTPAGYIAKFYPKTEYVGFKLVAAGEAGGIRLYLYMRYLK